jgi:sulfatase maturation enzyme AslB (radical SAM superfamily)
MFDLQHLLSASPHFCMMPWIHMHFWPDGRAFPCCIANSDMPIGRYGEKSLAELWNAEPLRRIRLNMLEDRPSEECRRCYVLERESNTYTLRKSANESFAHHLARVQSTRSDGSVEELFMGYLDIRFSNLCNFRCHTCGPQLSSAWAQDQEKAFGSLPHPPVIKVEPSERFWKELEPLLLGVERGYFAGGEPLICEDHYRILELWLRHGKVDVEITYTTNFSNFYLRGKDILDYWKRFPRVRISASLDASGTRAEYLRKGTIWSDIVANRRRMIAQCPNVYFELNPTISCFNVLHFPDFHRDWIDQGLVEPNHLRVNLLTAPSYMSIQILPRDYKQQVAARYQTAMEELIAQLRREGKPYDNIQSGYSSVIAFLGAADRTELTGALLERVGIIDRVRNESVFDFFPELSFLRDKPALTVGSHAG